MNDVLHQTVCASCHHVMAEPANFCPKCGTRVISLTEDERLHILAALDELDRGPLIGRRDLLEAQLPNLMRPKLGKGASLRIDGEAGVGKTLFVSALAGIARLMGFKTHILRAVAEERYLSFSPFRHLAAQAAGFEEARSVEDLHARLNDLIIEGFGPADAEYLKLLFPVEYKGLKTRKLAETVRLQSAMASLDRLLRVLSTDRPLFLVLDQIRYADPFSRLFWETLEASLADRPIFMVTIAREVQEPIPNAHHITRLSLPALEQRDIETLLGRWAGNKPIPAPCLEVLTDHAKGNPALARSLFHYARNNQILNDHNGLWIYNAPTVQWCPASLTETVHRQMETLSPPQGELLRLVAVLGEESTIEVLKDLYSFKEYLDEDLKSVVEKGFLVAEDGIPPRVRLREAFMAEAIYAEMSPAMRHEFHKKAGARLQKGTRQPLMTTNAVLFHLIQTTDAVPDALYYLEQSADKLFKGIHVVLAGMCYQKAGQLLRKELAETPRRFAVQLKLTHVLRKFARCQSAMRDRANAVKTLHAAMKLADDINVPYQSFQLRMEIARHLTDLGQTADAKRLLDQATSRVNGLSDKLFTGEILASAGEIFRDMNDQDAAQGCLEVAHGILQDGEANVGKALRRDATVCLNLARLHLERGELSRGLELLHGAYETTDADETPGVFLDIVLLLTATYAQQKLAAEARRFAELGRKTALAFGDNQILPQMSFRLGRAHTLEKDTESAKKFFSLALTESQDSRWNDGIQRSALELRKLGGA